MVRVRDLSKAFGGNPVLEGVDLTVLEGTVTALIGPSGAGKSTLLRCMNLLERPDAGEIEIGSHRIDARSRFSKRQLYALRRETGMVFQHFNLFPHMSVMRNVVLPQQRILGRSKAEAEHRAQELLARMGLADKGGQYPNKCSGGQQQRIAIARALALEPRVMLFDEPTSALDPEVGAEVLEVMKELAAEGMTMIVVTHEMGFARNVCEDLVVMADGGIIEQGDPQRIMGDPSHPRTRSFLHAVLQR
ncbi:ATP-binding cassette domain-containing protein [Brevibacterium sp. 5221]|uniref:ATP-binding cassette domain-containing protein n=1 Tax=Brevibacterium rongguiense TaxID=2695267 RepID=A0A6N9H649_9MICO|nr:amino acid ABC transporter ATP-binding protein [Brevibacterium rongguiense]MYM19518.1 ATP-binding cassette domain-containing protein [Brevibacterium rongguiense]WAL41683.1 amino acid ABC transporter ATP-binding protein [Brevibacterium sp. BRM-1]